MQSKRTQKSGDKDLALAEKVFNGLPKLFHPKFKAGMYGYEYCFFINKSATYSPWNSATYSPWNNDCRLIIIDLDEIVQEVYNNKFLDITPDVIIGFNDLAIFPDSFKKKLLKAFLHKVKELFSHKRSLIIECDMPKGKFKKIVMHSFEELLMNIGMMTVE